MSTEMEQKADILYHSNIDGVLEANIARGKGFDNVKILVFRVRNIRKKYKGDMMRYKRTAYSIYISRYIFLTCFMSKLVRASMRGRGD